MKSDLLALLLVVLIAGVSGYFLFRDKPLETHILSSTTYTSSDREGNPFYWFYFENEQFWGAVLVEGRYHYVGEERTENESIVRFKDMNEDGYLKLSINKGEIILLSQDGSTQDVASSFTFPQIARDINKGSFDLEKHPELEIFNQLLQSSVNHHEPVAGGNG